MNLGQMRRPWRPDTGPNRYRRGLYTFFWRATPFAFLATFDGPGGVQACTRRMRSNTPLQALTMLNDLVVIEAAQALGKRIAESPGTDEDRMALLYRRCLMRDPSKEERDALLEFYHRQHDRLKAGKLNAKTIAGGDGKDVVECAAWTLEARTVLNLDEMITKE